MKTDYMCVNSDSFKNRQKFGIAELAMVIFLALIIVLIW